MKTILLIAFGVASLVLGVLFLKRALYLYMHGRRAKRVLSSIQIFTIGVFVSTVLVFIPIYYTSYDFGDPYSFFRPLLIAVHNSFRIFILDGDFDIIVKSVSDQHIITRIAFSFYAACLYVIAPVLTFSNVLSLFKNIKGELRYKWSRRKPSTLCRNSTKNPSHWPKVFIKIGKMRLLSLQMCLSKTRKKTMNF